MRILHLGVDDKFTNFFFETCEYVLPGRNRYLVVDEKEALQYVRPAAAVSRVKPGFLHSTEMRQILAKSRVLVIHFLTDAVIDFLPRVPEQVVVVWSGWGKDYYARFPSFRQWAYQEKTRKLMSELEPDRAPAGLVDRIRCKIADRCRKHQEKKAIGRINYFSSPLPQDYPLVRAAFPSFSARYLQLNYGSVEDTFQVGPDTVSGKNILVGNSADPANNHLEVFDVLKDLDLSDRLIYVPLSYGDRQYRDRVISAGNALFGGRFSPLLDFMPLEQYNRTVASCGTVIMNHRRQQAIGNIGTMLYKGAKLFLNGEGIAFGFFAGQGAHLSSVAALDARDERVFDELAEHQVAENRRILDTFWGRGVVERNLALLGELVEE
jgi:dTDP-N-acetylfucosamine:lipid II N-acetylfucosaminyltransferase